MGPGFGPWGRTRPYDRRRAMFGFDGVEIVGGFCLCGEDSADGLCFFCFPHVPSQQMMPSARVISRQVETPAGSEITANKQNPASVRFNPNRTDSGARCIASGAGRARYSFIVASFGAKSVPAFARDALEKVLTALKRLIRTDPGASFSGRRAPAPSSLRRPGRRECRHRGRGDPW